MTGPLKTLGAALALALSMAAVAPTHAAPGDSYDNAARRLIEMGRDNLRQEAYGDALEMFESALVADPSSVDALIAIGDTYDVIDRRDRSLRYYRQALQIEPNNRAALTAEALALIADGDRSGAEDNLERLRRICGEAGCAEIDRLEQALAQADAEAGSEAGTTARTAQSDTSGDGGR